MSDNASIVYIYIMHNNRPELIQQTACEQTVIILDQLSFMHLHVAGNNGYMPCTVLSSLYILSALFGSSPGKGEVVVMLLHERGPVL